jgi:hypothetical protein
VELEVSGRKKDEKLMREVVLSVYSLRELVCVTAQKSVHSDVSNMHIKLLIFPTLRNQLISKTNQVA